MQIANLIEIEKIPAQFQEHIGWETDLEASVYIFLKDIFHNYSKYTFDLCFNNSKHRIYCVQKQNCLQVSFTDAQHRSYCIYLYFCMSRDIGYKIAFQQLASLFVVD